MPSAILIWDLDRRTQLSLAGIASSSVRCFGIGLSAMANRAIGANSHPAIRRSLVSDAGNPQLQALQDPQDPGKLLSQRLTADKRFFLRTGLHLAASDNLLLSESRTTRSTFKKLVSQLANVIELIQVHYHIDDLSSSFIAQKLCGQIHEFFFH